MLFAAPVNIKTKNSIITVIRRPKTNDTNKAINRACFSFYFSFLYVKQKNNPNTSVNIPVPICMNPKKSTPKKTY